MLLALPCFLWHPIPHSDSNVWWCLGNSLLEICNSPWFTHLWVKKRSSEIWTAFSERILRILCWSWSVLQHPATQWSKYLPTFQGCWNGELGKESIKCCCISLENIQIQGSYLNTWVIQQDEARGKVTYNIFPELWLICLLSIFGMLDKASGQFIFSR